MLLAILMKKWQLNQEPVENDDDDDATDGWSRDQCQMALNTQRALVV